MKTTFFKKLTVLVLLMTSSIGLAWAESIDVVLVKAPFIHVDEDPIPDRMPSRPIQCTISDDGIFIQGYDASEILSYEVYDLDGTCVLATYDTQRFVTFVLSASETFEIRILTKNSIFRGYMYGV